MYKYLIVGVTFLVLGGAGYYFNSSGGGDLVAQAIVNGDGAKGGTSAELYSGTYECTSDTGCETPYLFILNDDTTFEVLEVVGTEEEDTKKLISTGSWGLGSGGTIVFLIDAIPSENKVSFSIIAKKITSLKISDFTNTKKLYPGMKSPIFKRIK